MSVSRSRKEYETITEQLYQEQKREGKEYGNEENVWKS